MELSGLPPLCFMGFISFVLLVFSIFIRNRQKEEKEAKQALAIKKREDARKAEEGDIWNKYS